ncbi:MnhB domain-containing protein [Pontibacter vulgaris]|uniref:MnhB domain-containing protein n=1 Tax=Pontibacter vulgaris TaxID=2905679 RepID=UPI001FA72F24|nr:MnhB domain-containing protein [Pontibacter vulgaris]
MKTLVLSVAIKLLIPVFLFFSLYCLFRGHNHPGGGFIGGLIASIAFIFHTMVHGPNRTITSLLKINLYGFEHQPNQSRSLFLMRMQRVKRWRRRCALDDKKSGKPDFRLDPFDLIATGLLVAATSGIVGFLLQEPYMSSSWFAFSVPFIGSIGTPVIFDIGVYLLVLGVVLKITFVMSEE